MLDKILSSSFPGVFSHYLEKSSHVIVVFFDDKNIIKDYNPAFFRLLQDPSRKSLKGENVTSYLFGKSKKLISFSSDETSKKVKLDFVLAADSTLPVECYLYKINQGFLLIGERMMQENEEVLEHITVLNNEMANMSRELNRKNRALREAQSKIKVLSGIIPICMNCKEIRDDKGYWNQLEKFITEHSEARFSHSICPDCLKKLYPGKSDTIEDE